MMAEGYTVSVLRPDGVEVLLNDNETSFLAEDWDDGIAPTDAIAPMLRRPGMDGASRVGRPYTVSRSFGIKWSVIGADLRTLSTYLATLNRHLSPYRSETLPGYVRIVSPDQRVRQIEALAGGQDVQMTRPTVATITQRFTSPSAFWFDPVASVHDIALSGPGGVTVPFAFDPTTGLPFAVSDIDSWLPLENDGDVPAWPSFRVYGPGDALWLKNIALNKFVSLPNLVLLAGDYVDIDMQARTIMKYTASGGTYLSILATRTPASQFWWLTPGTNSTHVVMTNVTDGSIRITWYNQYRSGL